MEQLFKKLDSFMMNDFVRKLGGFVCILILGVSAVAFFIGAGDLFCTDKKADSTEETSDEHGDGEAADDEDQMDEEEYDEDE
ncbi:MAG: hypothetical protein GY941_27200 [Planctomycetes bacterium]|nr:hypothetical protein [Planctomycetota bacterium]